MANWFGRGVVAQLVEHLLCKQGVRGSNPLNSTIQFRFCKNYAAMLVEYQFFKTGCRGAAGRRSRATISSRFALLLVQTIHGDAGGFSATEHFS